MKAIKASYCEVRLGEGTLFDSRCEDINCCGVGDGLLECWACGGTGKET